MKKTKLISFISLGGILSAITVILQSAPILLPAIGLAISPFSTLPVALATIINIYLGVGVLFSSGLILIAVSLQEAVILIFATGLLGLVLGVLLYRKGLFLTIGVSLISLMTGLLILTFIVVIPGFVEFTSSLSIFTTLIIYFILSLFYVSIWVVCLRRFINYLIKIKLIEM
jgi:hypothetical protein